MSFLVEPVPNIPVAVGMDMLLDDRTCLSVRTVRLNIFALTNPFARHGVRVCYSVTTP